MGSIPIGLSIPNVYSPLNEVGWQGISDFLGGSKLHVWLAIDDQKKSCGDRDPYSVAYSLSPTAETTGLNPVQSGFESQREYQGFEDKWHSCLIVNQKVVGSIPIGAAIRPKV